MKRTAALLASGLVLAGCGGSHRANEPTTSQRALGVLRELARCVRANGVSDFPDPVLGHNGVPAFPDRAPRIPSAAQRACNAIVARMPAGYTSTTPVSAADFHKLLVLARCIRAHGNPNWPDPNPLGEFSIGPD